VLSWAVGFFFETVGDAQLAAFKADPANKGKVMDRGLWRYTRHPNYFGDAAVWWGLTLLALHHAAGLIGLVSAALMTWLLAKGTGAALLERSIGEAAAGLRGVRAAHERLHPPPPEEDGVLNADHVAQRSAGRPSSEVVFLAARYPRASPGRGARPGVEHVALLHERHLGHGVAAGVRHARDVHDDHRPGLRPPLRARVPNTATAASNAGPRGTRSGRCRAGARCSARRRTRRHHADAAVLPQVGDGLHAAAVRSR
jgi:hypothetical protein